MPMPLSATSTTANEPERFTISRRGLIVGGGAFAVVGLVTACSEGGGGEAASTTATSPPRRGAPGDGGGTVTVRDPGGRVLVGVLSDFSWDDSTEDEQTVSFTVTESEALP